MPNPIAVGKYAGAVGIAGLTQVGCDVSTLKQHKLPSQYSARMHQQAPNGAQNGGAGAGQALNEFRRPGFITLSNGKTITFRSSGKS
jgi:hypothetical protein